MNQLYGCIRGSLGWGHVRPQWVVIMRQLLLDILLFMMFVTMALSWLKYDLNWVTTVVSNHYQKNYSHNPIQTCVLHLLAECSELICFWATFAKFWPSSCHKWLKMVVSNHYQKKYSHNPIQTCVLHLWLSVDLYWLAFWLCWPNFGPLGGVRPLSE